MNDWIKQTSLALALGAACLATAQAADDVRTGQAAYGDWHADAPGVMRRITPADVVAPLASPSAANRSRVVAQPVGAQLVTMPGFTVKPFATGRDGARVVRIAPNGDIFLSQSRPEGKITVFRPSATGDAPEKTEIFAANLKDPYGIAFYPPGPDPKFVYVGIEGGVVRFPYHVGDMMAAGPAETIVSGIPKGVHWTRDVAFSPDGATMYLAVGSGSNVANEMEGRPADLAAFEKSHALGAAWGREEYRADVLRYTPEGKERGIYAAGIRNCSGLAIQPGTASVWCATNERDLLGDNTPPDYVTSVKPGAFYGWPWYYIGDHEDTRPGDGPRPDLKGHVTVPDVLLQPHSAPLGMAFNPGGMFPADWTGDAFIALHGSWNRANHTGYKIVRLPFKGAQPTGDYQDFVVGFAAGEADVWGRPVDVVFAKDGSLLFTDDGNGVVYRVTYAK